MRLCCVIMLRKYLSDRETAKAPPFDHSVFMNHLVRRDGLVARRDDETMPDAVKTENDALCMDSRMVTLNTEYFKGSLIMWDVFLGNWFKMSCPTRVELEFQLEKYHVVPYVPNISETKSGLDVDKLVDDISGNSAYVNQNDRPPPSGVVRDVEWYEKFQRYRRYGGIDPTWCFIANFGFMDRTFNFEPKNVPPVSDINLWKLRGSLFSQRIYFRIFAAGYRVDLILTCFIGCNRNPNGYVVVENCSMNYNVTGVNIPLVYHCSSSDYVENPVVDVDISFIARLRSVDEESRNVGCDQSCNSHDVDPRQLPLKRKLWALARPSSDQTKRNATLFWPMSCMSELQLRLEEIIEECASS